MATLMGLVKTRLVVWTEVVSLALAGCGQPQGVSPDEDRVRLGLGPAPHTCGPPSDYVLYRIEEDPSAPQSDDTVRLIGYAIPSWTVVLDVEAIVDRALRLSVLARWGTLAVQLERALRARENEAIADLLREGAPPVQEYSYCGVSALSRDRRYMASFYYSPLGLPAAGCGAGFAQYRLCDLQEHRAFLVADRCWHNPESDFSGFVQAPSVCAYLLGSRPSADGWCTDFNATVDYIRPDGSVGSVTDLVACWIRASPSGDRVVLAQIDMDAVGLRLEMRSADLNTVYWRTHLASSGIGCNHVLWSEDSAIVLVFPYEANMCRGVFYSAADGHILLDSTTPFVGLSSRGPLALARRGDVRNAMKMLGLTSR